jgi:hypothetical protein
VTGVLLEPPKRRISQSRVFEQLGYRPHVVQREMHFHEQYERFLLLCAGRRMGKSHLGGRRLTIEALRAKFRPELSRTGHRSEFWIVGPEYSDAEKEFRVLYDGLTKLGVPMDKPGTYYNPESGQLDLSLWDGAFQVHGKSAKYPKTLVGEALEGVIMVEAAKLKPSVWDKYIRPMLSDYRGWAEFTSTPEGKNWFYDLYRRGQDPADKEIFSKRAPSWMNEFLFPLGREDPEIQSLAAGMSEEKFKQEIGADFTEFVGRVFKRFNEDDNVGDYPYDPRWPVVAATDYGYTNPNVMLLIQYDVFDNVWVIGEYYRRNRTPEEFARDLDDHPTLGPLLRTAVRDLYPDPEDPGSSNVLAQKFKLNIHSGTGGLLKDRLDLIRRWLTPQPLELPDGHEDKRPKLHFDRTCTETIREMNDYRYPETRLEAKETETRENPLKVDDHAPETLGRFFAGKYGKEEKAKRKTRIAQARSQR